MRNNIKNGAVRVLSFVVDMLLVGFVFYYTDLFIQNFINESCFCYENVIIAEALNVFFFYMFDLYAAKEGSREQTVISVVLSSVITAVCGAIISIFVFDKYTLAFTASLVVTLMISLVLWRLILSFALVRFREKNKILILESSKVPTRLARKLKYSCTNVNEAWYYILDEDNDEDYKYVVDKLIDEYDTVFISEEFCDDVQNGLFEKALLANKTVNLLAVPANVSLMGGRIYQFEDTPVIELGSIYMEKHQKFLKRAFDLFVAAVGLIITSPFFLIIPIFIKLDSPGPVFYTQERYTVGKKRFKLYKFRTMCQDAEKNGEMLATKNDSRITRVGGILRKLRLDELPQFLNILAGSMSVVGPRPERPVFADEFCEKVRHYNMRYTMKAGLTGYAQVYGKYNTRVSDKILMDMIYAIKYSFWLDIKLVILTVKTMFVKDSTEGVDEDFDEFSEGDEKEAMRKGNTAVLHNIKTEETVIE